MRRLLIFIAFVTILLSSAAKSQEPWFFALLADSQWAGSSTPHGSTSLEYRIEWPLISWRLYLAAVAV
jgi:hypothetical protein